LALLGFIVPLAQLQAADDDAGAMVTKAVAYLTSHQGEDGSFSPQTGPAVTAMVVASVLHNGRTAEDPVVAKGLKYLEKFVQEDGGIYQKDTFHKNYETCISLMAFSAANKSGKYDALVKKAEAFIKDIQFDAGESKSKEDIEYGGAGYGRSKRPDLSNTSFFLDALKSVGNDQNSEAIQRALVFVSRCQNLESEHNKTPFPAKNPDGGFYYTPVGEQGNSQAGTVENGGLRSYASMTYAGLKSMLYAGLKQDDVRVKAAVTWLKKNYTLKENPGMDQAGLFYYYNVMSKALKTLGQNEFVDESGTKHDWRKEMIAELKSRQKEDGSWVNAQARWMEGDANLVTAYALMALSNCK
jgi:squalene-hopene/tetraprenyl-beta-curcumene cyclase